MRHLVETISIIGLLLFVTDSSISASPSRGGVVTFSQPDGLEICVELFGDEYASFYLTADNIMVARDSSNTWRYVTAIGKNGISLSSIIAHNEDSRGYSEKLFVSSISQRALISAKENLRKEKEAENHPFSTKMLMSHASDNDANNMIGPYSTTGFPCTGKAKGLVILAQFSDRSFSKSEEEIRNIFFNRLNKENYSDQIIINGQTFPGSIGSVKDYFVAQSYGQFTPQFDVIGPYTTTKEYAYYGSDIGGIDNNAREMVLEVCHQAYLEGVDFSQYDADHNGIIDFVYIIYAGNPQNYTGSDENTIWPHQVNLITPYLIGSNTLLYGYACSSELFGNTTDVISGIGDICHEFSHILGLVDCYFKDANNGVVSNHFTMRNWSVMDYGNFDNNGFSPCGYTAFERYSLGWMELTDISTPGTYTLPDLDQEGVAYRLRTSNENQYIILENHQKKGWFSYQPSAGLMATAVNYNKTNWQNNRINTGGNIQGYYIIAADNSFKNDTQEGDLYPYHNNDSLTINSQPASIILGGSSVNIPIHNIRNGKELTFNIPSRINNGINTTDNNVLITCADGILSVTAADGTQYSVFSITGCIVHTGTTFAGHDSYILPAHGIYLVKCGSRTFKVSR